MTLQDVKVRQAAPLGTPSNLSSNSVNLTGPQGRRNDNPLHRTYFPSPTSTAT
jgi:hypothetical protein